MHFSLRMAREHSYLPEGCMTQTALSWATDVSRAVGLTLMDAA